MKTIRKFLKALSLLTLMSSITIMSIAKTKDSALIKLQSKKWEMQGLTNKTYEEKYVKNHVTSYLDGKHFVTFEFYLSDSIVTAFDPNKEGMIDDGRYIISRMVRDKDDKRPTPLLVMEIIALEENMMILKNIKTNIIIEYKAK